MRRLTMAESSENDQVCQRKSQFLLPFKPKFILVLSQKTIVRCYLKLPSLCLNALILKNTFFLRLQYYGLDNVGKLLRLKEILFEDLHFCRACSTIMTIFACKVAHFIFCNVLLKGGWGSKLSANISQAALIAWQCKNIQWCSGNFGEPWVFRAS